ncbi:hypothetical protein ACFOW4_11550 [Micromonospora sp. GCM10011542]|uniref:hypothetical protein n=1 Tax=Micromonospora sp. GCM10011542 TaxID=3317337 RepID=UPI00361F7275
MSEELPIPRQGDRSDGPAVIEWGAVETTRRRRFAGSLAGLGRDPRLPLLIAGLGAVAAVASLVGEWLVMTPPNRGPEGDAIVRLPAGVSEIGGFGVAYLVGLLALVCAVALALRGTPAVRSNARLAGLTLAGALLALLVATASALDESGQRTLFYSSEDGFRAEYGRGLVMAFVACVLFGTALRLAPGGGTAPAGPERDAGRAPASDDDRDAASGPRSRSGAANGGWRRRPGRDPEEGPPPPADLTVTPAAPFARPEPPA